MDALALAQLMPSTIKLCVLNDIKGWRFFAHRPSREAYIKTGREIHSENHELELISNSLGYCCYMI
jgi:hypothetical protein